MGAWFRQKGMWFFAFLLLFFGSFSRMMPVSASDGGASHTLTVSCFVEDTPQEGKSFDLYRVGAFVSDFQVVYEDAFAGREFPNEITDSKVYQDLSMQLQTFVSESHIDPKTSELTSSDGLCCFEGLPNGLYLVSGRSYSTDKYQVTFEPMLLSVTDDLLVETKHSLTDLSDPKDPNKPNKPSVPEKSTTNEKLPQTGMLQWPILACLVVAIVCLCLSVSSVFKKREIGVVLFSIGVLSLGIALGLKLANMQVDAKARLSSSTVLNGFSDLSIDMEALDDTDGGNQAVRLYQGEGYLGVLGIPDLGVELPVNLSWSYPRLKISPCRYAGVPGASGFVICAHNYDSHFGRIKTLQAGSSISFTDVSGKVYDYEVVKTEILDPYDAASMLTDQYDLTLFTCTYGGRSRVTVRCQKIQESDGV